jgi:3-dehydroquinate synthase
MSIKSSTFAGRIGKKSMIKALEDIVSQYEQTQIFVLADGCLALDLPYPTLRMEASEENKSLESASEIWTWLTKKNATRKAVLVNIGGGTICDLGGFAAATYLRGIDYINVPTTLLAMVDAAIGGKTGVNHGGLKNRVGVFRMPKAVIIEPSFLETLPTDELLSGFGEVLKTALLIGDGVFASALSALDKLASLGRLSRVSQLIDTCRAYKESVVAQDSTETGLRKVLNFGHTVGHAIEESLASHSETLTLPAAKRSLHGYCVVWGMVAELYLSVVLLGCPKELLQQMTKVLLDYYGRPNCNCKQQEELINFMRQDKKNAASDAINFTLLKKAGDPIINQVAPKDLIKEALDYLFSV